MAMAVLRRLDVRETLTAPGFASREYLVRLLSGFWSLVLVALIVGLTPAAYADPPDPSWIGGSLHCNPFFPSGLANISKSPYHRLRPSQTGPRWGPPAPGGTRGPA